MTNAEIIKGLKAVRTIHNGNYAPFIDEAIKELKAREWIPISKELPEEGKTVMASTKHAVYPEARYTKECGWEWAYESGADYWVELTDVTAWMPLPKPYKSQESE